MSKEMPSGRVVKYGNNFIVYEKEIGFDKRVLIPIQNIERIEPCGAGIFSRDRVFIKDENKK